MGGAGMGSTCEGKLVVMGGAGVFVTGGLLEPKQRELVGPWKHTTPAWVTLIEL